ncbi:MAG: hypothetical protein IT337_03785 [Thermomicrobiales bacterium]|nr:hypothetical protein [Thermomicrobiales bacterium]
MLKRMPAVSRIAVAVWTVWLGVVWVTNALDALRALGALPRGWKLASGNFALISKATAVYRAPRWVNALLFFGVIVWEGAAAAAFWRAATAPDAIALRSHAAPAFALSIGLFGSFLVADELFLAFDDERAHWPIFIALLASALVVRGDAAAAPEALPGRSGRA